MTAGATVASRRVIRMGGRAQLGIFAMVVAVLLFSGSSTLVKWADTPGSVVAFWRMLISVVLWWVVIAARKVRTGRPAPTRRTWWLVLPAGLCFGLNITLFFTAIGRTSIAHAEFITALSPILLVPLGALLFHERPDRRALPWGAVSLVGLAIVLFAGGSQGGASVGGDLIVVVVVMLWIGYLLTGRRARATVDVFDFMATMMPIGVLTAAPVALLIAGGDIWPLSAKAWLAAGLLGIMTGMLGHGLIAFSQREIPIATIGIIQVGQPALAVGWSVLILGEAIKPAQIPGMVLVLVGLAAFTLVSQRRPQQPVPAATVDPDQHGELTGPVG
jgi:drug/metabolite transporter (DMT)-like permease